MDQASWPQRAQEATDERQEAKSPAASPSTAATRAVAKKQEARSTKRMPGKGAKAKSKKLNEGEKRPWK